MNPEYVTGLIWEFVDGRTGRSTPTAMQVVVTMPYIKQKDGENTSSMNTMMLLDVVI